MGAILEYDISVVGLKNVDAAFAHIEKRAREANRRIAQQGSAAARSGGRVDGVPTAARRAAVVDEDKLRAASAARIEKIRERSAARIAKLERDAALKTEKDREALRLKAARAAERHQARMRRLDEAAEKRKKQRKEESDRILAADDQRRKWRAAEALERKNLANARAANADRLAKKERFASAVGSSALGSVVSIGRAAMGAAAIGGTALLGSALYAQSQESVRASQLANQAGTPGRKGEILAQAQGIQGFTGMEALEGLGAWTDLTGDLATGQAILGELGQTALATGTNLEDLAAAAANAFIPLQDSIPDSTKRLEALKNVIRSTAGMGAVGAVEIKDLASEMAGLAAQASKFEGGPERVMQTAVAMAQASRQRGGSSSAAEAVTAVERFGSDVMTKQKDLRAMGVEVFTDKSHTQLRDQESIIQDVLAATHGDLGKIGGIFNERSLRAVQGFSPLYNEAEKRKKGTGKAAVAAEFERLRKATLSDEGVKARVDSRMQDADIQFKETLKALNAELGSQFLPIVTDLIKALKNATPQIVEIGKAAAGIAKWAVANPFEGVAALVAAKVSADIAGAAIGASVQKSIETALGGAAGMKLGALTITAALAYLTVKTLADANDAAVDKAVERTAETSNIISRAAAENRATDPMAFLNWAPGADTGTTLSPEMRTKAQAELTRLQALKTEAAARAKPPVAGGGTGMGGYAAPSGAAGPGDLLMGGLTDWMGVTSGGGLEGRATHEREVERASQGAYDKDIAALMAELGMAARELKEGGAAINKAAGGLNRGNAPSPAPAVK